MRVKKVMLIGEVARAANVCPETVRAWVARGELRAERTANRTRLFDADDVARFLQRRRTRAGVDSVA